MAVATHPDASPMSPPFQEPESPLAHLSPEQLDDRP